VCAKKERCPYCLGTNLRPKGWNRKRTKRRLKCQNCKRHITQAGKSWFVSEEQISYINLLLAERLSLRGICRVIKVSISWLLKYMMKLYDSQPDDLHYRQPPQGKNFKVTSDGLILQLIDIELDEMWSFVGKKTNKQWIWIALCRRTRQVIAFHIGNRSRESAKALWGKMPRYFKENGQFYSDDWDAYKGVFPLDRHISSKFKKDTNHLERLNNTIRHRCSRLVRKTLAFSKKVENHILAIKYFFCQYNLEQQHLWDKV